MLKGSRLWARPVSRLGPRRLPVLLVLLSLLAVLLIGSLSSAVPASPSLSAYEHKITLPRISDALPKGLLKPSHQSLQLPPHQKSGEHNGTSWLADERWLSAPFSSSVTFDAERVLLPLLTTRQPIYCYYDTSAKKTRDERDAEGELLLTWRRAWWAQGFRPMILGAAEATSNPMYEQVQKTAIASELREDLMRWLAWDSANGGILSDFTVLPIAPRQDPLLLFLQGGEYANLTRWADLDDAFLVGQKSDVHLAIQSILQIENIQEATSVTTALSDLVVVDSTKTPLAYYSSKTIEAKYAKIIRKESRAHTLHSLNELINYHILVAWQNNFPEGIEVLKPHPQHATAMLTGALKLAKRLSSCPKNPMPSTCPPNLPKCFPCVASPMAVSTPSRFRNSPQIFTIGVVPHPWSFALVDNQRESINVTWIVESPRDKWLSAVTQGYLGSGVSSNRRVMRFKELVAGELPTALSLWLPAENEVPNDLDWYFGFTIPEKGMHDGKSRSPVPADRLPKDEEPDRANGPVASAEDVAREQDLLDRAKNVVMLNKSSNNGTKMRASLEAWNMADTEAWRFTRAFNARRFLEREEWERTYRQSLAFNRITASGTDETK
ncbi:hypothetical protein TARUN_6008 [Trichoderma arundinaceum]|uniref:Uncharacterized protein n=1 Tax=Trichoderma arundinaceum TaxID=490622 RepID=A0A395NJF5_TRIAR|nr:hypothetical protein TARUN_6008 [Trichoderma arundinaceum]